MIEDLLTEVAVVRADSYEAHNVEQSIVRLLDLLGGLDRFVKRGMRVLIKPNLLSAKGPDRAITTHPELVATVARMVRDLGGRVLIGDSPAGAKTGIQRVWDETGYSDMARRNDLELVSFEASGTTPVAVDTRVYYVSKPALEADLIINMPKLKTHVLTLMTGAVKNMFGVIPGFRKGMYHKEAPTPRRFSRIVVDIFSTVQPELNIMDAVVAMEGDGPASGTPRTCGLLMASADAVALDTVAGHIIGLDPAKVHTTRMAADAGLGIGWLEGVAVLGESLDSVRVRDFKLTSNRAMEFIPKLAVDVISPFLWLRPKVDETKCTGCGDCVNSCPTKALQTLNGDGLPSLTKELCINCWCCHEICPADAVFIDKSWLARRFIH